MRPFFTAIAMMALLATANANAQQRAVGGGARITYPSQSHNFSWERGHRRHGGFGGGVFVVEREVPVVVEKEVPAPPPASLVPLPEQARGGTEARKPYVIGASYASLPGGCMKLIEQAASYYFCGGGEWYRQVGDGRQVSYKAVARRL